MHIRSSERPGHHSAGSRRINASDSNGPGGIAAGTASSPQALSALECSVLLTVLYAELFDYALTRDELVERLVGGPSSPARIDEAATRLTDSYLSAAGDFVVWRGREDLIDLRRRRQSAAHGLWTTARRYGTWLACVPFLRMVAVSDSLAVENAEPDSDVDLFCITQPNRLWFARLFIVPLSKLTRRFPSFFPRYLCPNYILAMDALEVADRNLFTAHEVAQAVPMWGERVFELFLDANDWVLGFLPHLKREAAPSGGVEQPRRPLWTRAVERTFGGRLGDGINLLAHRLFISFYRRRAVKAGWNWTSLEPAYRLERYTVPEGGYVRVVRQLYERLVHERLGRAVPPADVSAFFPDTAGSAPACYDWDVRFREDYGPACSRSALVNASRRTT